MNIEAATRANAQIDQAGRRVYQESFVPLARTTVPVTTWLQRPGPYMISSPAGISPVESTWVACYDWCLT
jgi:hypothetical protein